MVAQESKHSVFGPVGDFIPKPFKLRSYSRGRADYFIVVLQNYEAAAVRTNHQPTPGVRDILQRVPQRSSSSTSADYQTAVAAAVSWSDCFVLERETVEAYPDVELAGNLRRQRIRYAQMASADEFANYIKTALDIDGTVVSASSTPFDRLRSELAMVTDRILYLLTVSAPRENARGWLTVWTVLLMLGGMVAIFATYFAIWHAYVAPTVKGAFVPSDSLFVVLFAGLIGGFVSVQQRLETPTDVDPLYKRIELEASGYSIIASPVIGMIFACVLFATMLGGLITGSVFPSFVCPDGDPRCGSHDLAAFAAGSTPVDTVSWAKLALWAFAAGFLERLVPDILTRLGTVATNAKS